MKKLILAGLLFGSQFLWSATVDVTVKIDKIVKSTIFKHAEGQNNAEFKCDCDQFDLMAKIVETFDDGLSIKFEFVDKNQEVIASPIFRLAWDKPAKLTSDECEDPFFELTVVVTKS